MPKIRHQKFVTKPQIHLTHVKPPSYFTIAPAFNIYSFVN